MTKWNVSVMSESQPNQASLDTISALEGLAYHSSQARLKIRRTLSSRLRLAVLVVGQCDLVARSDVEQFCFRLLNPTAPWFGFRLSLDCSRHHQLYKDAPAKPASVHVQMASPFKQSASTPYIGDRYIPFRNTEKWDIQFNINDVSDSVGGGDTDLVAVARSQRYHTATGLYHS